MTIDPAFVIPGVIVLAVVCLMALFAAVGIAVVSGVSVAFLLRRGRVRNGETLESVRLWEELARSTGRDTERL